MDNFAQQKKDILSKNDKSSIGGWDKKIVKLCEKINKKQEYYTTSSCAGRVLLIIDSPEKQPDLFVKAHHELISFEELKEDLNKISKVSCSEPDICQGSLLKNKLSDNKFKRKIMHNSDLKQHQSASASARAKQDVRFKQEPCILHVACKTFEDAQKLYDKAKLAGWKRSGIIAAGKRFVVELNSTEKLEFPIVAGGKILVDDSFLKVVIKKSNENMKKSWEKIEKLEKSIK